MSTDLKETSSRGYIFEEAIYLILDKAFYPHSPPIKMDYEPSVVLTTP